MRLYCIKPTLNLMTLIHGEASSPRRVPSASQSTPRTSLEIRDSIAMTTTAPTNRRAPITGIATGLAFLAALMCLAAPAGATELKLLSQGLPAASYSTDVKPGKDSGPEKAFDGKWTGAATVWCNGPKYPTWLMVDLGSDYSLIKTMTYMEKPNIWYSYTVEVSSDKEHWTMFSDQSKNKDASEDPAYADMGLAVARYVRLTLTDAPERDKQWFWPAVMEFQVFGVAVDKPAEEKAGDKPGDKKTDKPEKK